MHGRELVHIFLCDRRCVVCKLEIICIYIINHHVFWFLLLVQQCDMLDHLLRSNILKLHWCPHHGFPSRATSIPHEQGSGRWGRYDLEGYTVTWWGNIQTQVVMKTSFSLDMLRLRLSLQLESECIPVLVLQGANKWRSQAPKANHLSELLGWWLQPPRSSEHRFRDHLITGLPSYPSKIREPQKLLGEQTRFLNYGSWQVACKYHISV